MQNFFCESHNQIRFFTPSYHDFSPHFHHTIEVIFIEEGSNCFNINGSIYDVNAGSVIFIPPNAIHSALSPKTQCRSAVLITDPIWLMGPAAKLSSLTPIHPVWTNPHKTSIIWPILRHISENISHISADTFTSLISSVINVILDDMPLQKVAPTSRAEQRILHYCQSHYLEPITINDLSSALGLSGSYISHVFSGTLKTSFPSYINGLRLFDAMSLLRTTSLPITVISEKAGFATLRTFNRVFQELTGQTPVQWRKDHASTAAVTPSILTERPADSQ